MPLCCSVDRQIPISQRSVQKLPPFVMAFYNLFPSLCYHNGVKGSFDSFYFYNFRRIKLLYQPSFQKDVDPFLAHCRNKSGLVTSFYLAELFPKISDLNLENFQQRLIEIIGMQLFKCDSRATLPRFCVTMVTGQKSLPQGGKKHFSA